MSTQNTIPVQPLEPVSDDKNLLASAAESGCCGGTSCCGG